LGRGCLEVLRMLTGGLDVHREQITFDWVDHETGELARGRITPATRERFRAWLQELPSREGAFALEGCTGWRFVVEALQEAGFEAHLAEPADSAALRGRKRRAKNDRVDARHQRELLEQGRLPASWIPPAHIADLRQTVRLRKALAEIRIQWQQRIHAVLFHMGLAKPDGGLLTRSSRVYLERVDAPSACRQVISVGLRQIDQVQQELARIDGWLRAYARRQPGCRALIAKHYGVSWITGPTILAELGDARRFRNRHAIVRHTGLDITVYASDSKRSPGRLSRQGPETLRWALYEAAKCHARRGAPHHGLYQQVKARQGGKRAALSVARQLVREIRHTLIALGDDALAPVDSPPELTLA
jgi:transposase